MFFLASCFFANTALAQKGKAFPTFVTEDLGSSSVEVPTGLKDKKRLVFLAFSQEAAEQLEDWYPPVYTLFLDDAGFNALAYDVDVRLVLMFTGAAQAATNKVIENLKRTTDSDLRDNVLFYQGSFREEGKELDIDGKDEPYVFVVDENGRILYATSGKYSDKKLEEISSLVEL